MALVSASSRHRHSLLHHLRLLSTSPDLTPSPSPSPSPSPPPPPPPKPAIVPVAVDPAIKRLAKLRRFSEIESLLEERKKKTPTKAANHESHLSSIIVSYAYAKMIDHAARTFDQMDSLGCAPRTAVSLNALLTSYTHTGHHAQVPELLADLSAKHSITPDEVSYGILIKALCELETPEKAYPVLKEMEEKNMEITVVHYTPIVDALYKKKKPEEAERVWKEMVERGRVPDVAAYNVRAMYRAHHRKPEAVLELMEEMTSAGFKPDIVTYNLLITCYCKNGKFLDAKKLYSSLREKKLRANAATYRSFVYFLCKNGDFDFAFRVCKDGLVKNKVPDIGPAKELTKGLVKNSKEEEAKWLIGELKERFPPSLTDAWKKVAEQLGLSIDEQGPAVVEAV